MTKPKHESAEQMLDHLIDPVTGFIRSPPVSRMTLHKANLPPPPNHVAEIRKLRGLTQQQLADAVNVSKRTIAKVEKGELRLAGMLPVHLAQALDVGPQSLGGEDAVAYAVAYSFATVEAQLAQQAHSLNQFMEWMGAPTARLIAAAEEVVKLWPADPKKSPELTAAVDELAASVSSTRGTH